MSLLQRASVALGATCVGHGVSYGPMLFPATNVAG